MKTPIVLCALAFAAACAAPPADEPPPAQSPVAAKLAKYTTVRLDADTSALKPWEKRILPILIEAARAMDSVFWEQAYGSPDSLLAPVTDAGTRRYLEINYGPWDRLDDNAAFLTGIGEKPKGANFYPRDMTKEEFERALTGRPRRRVDSLKSLYTLVRRDAQGNLKSIPYRDAFREQNLIASAKLRDAAALTEERELRSYLDLRAAALLTDDYQPSDLAWMDMKNNTLDIIIGPIETYEDELFGYKAANEAFVLIKDKAWSDRLSKYAALLPGLQKGLPVAAKYKREVPGTDSDLNAYDAVYYAGQANAAVKTIAINLPNDESVQLKKGTRRLQLKNTIRAKFDKILTPIVQDLIAADQVSLVDFDAFFENVMFHEVAHGLGIKNTITRRPTTVRAALKERAGALEEEKADVLGLYMVQSLTAQGEMRGDVKRNYVAFLASLFRSSRFGGADAHGRANIVSFNFLAERSAFVRDSTTATYRVDFEKMKSALNELTQKILTMQGDGDYAAVEAFQTQYGTIGPQLRADLDRLGTKGIPVDLVFEMPPRR
ncbi:MAG TPA: hypothetical protein VJR92_01920 [Gemmatimonadaceae bacterium]|nr:hypothetical protein [Gemmatimonadaceae bacterium]